MKESVKNHFDSLVERYQSNFDSTQKSGKNFNFSQRLAIACEIADRFSGNLLECAVGTGEITNAILNLGKFDSATVVDISSEMLNRAKKDILADHPNHKINFVNADIFDFLNNCSEQFNLIICLGLIAHVGQIDILLKHLKQKLLPEGCLILQTTLADHLGTKVVRLLTENQYYQKHGYQISYFNSQNIEQICRQVGLEIMEIKRYSLGIPFADKVFPLINYYLELKMQSFASRNGSEAIYCLRKIEI